MSEQTADELKAELTGLQDAKQFVENLKAMAAAGLLPDQATLDQRYEEAKQYKKNTENDIEQKKKDRDAIQASIEKIRDECNALSGDERVTRWAQADEEMRPLSDQLSVSEAELGALEMKLLSVTQALVMAEIHRQLLSENSKAKSAETLTPTTDTVQSADQGHAKSSSKPAGKMSSAKPTASIKTTTTEKPKSLDDRLAELTKKMSSAESQLLSAETK